MSQAAAPLLAHFSRTMNRFHLADPTPSAAIRQIVTTSVSLAGADVYGAGIVGFESGDIGSHDVADKNIVPRLFTVAIDDRTFSGKQL